MGDTDTEHEVRHVSVDGTGDFGTLSKAFRDGESGKTGWRCFSTFDISVDMYCVLSSNLKRTMQARLSDINSQIAHGFTLRAMACGNSTLQVTCSAVFAYITRSYCLLSSQPRLYQQPVQIEQARPCSQQ